MWRLILFLSFWVNSFLTGAWGFWAHKHITYQAIFVLRGTLFESFRFYMDVLVEKSVNPDKRRFSDPHEHPRHFINFEKYQLYDSLGVKLLKCKFDYIKKNETHLEEKGIAPWYIQHLYQDLVKAFKFQKIKQIINLAADLSHYIADLHVPLHTTFYYNGKEPYQKGIHKLLETTLLELYGNDFLQPLPKAKKIHDLSDFIYRYTRDSYYLVDSVYYFYDMCYKQFNETDIYTFRKKNTYLVKEYSQLFCSCFYKGIGLIIAQRFNAAAQAVGNIWFTAWLEAGSPIIQIISDMERERINFYKEWEPSTLIYGRSH